MFLLLVFCFLELPCPYAKDSEAARRWRRLLTVLPPTCSTWGNKIKLERNELLLFLFSTLIQKEPVFTENLNWVRRPGQHVANGF